MQKLLVLLALVFTVSAHADWKSVFISGDDSIPNFDNGRQAISELFHSLGAYKEFQTHLTSDKNLVTPQVKLATINNIARAFVGLGVNQKVDGCLLFMTSHGIKNFGFYLSSGYEGKEGAITPDQLSQIVDATCGQAPTVLLISACYSGQFIQKLARDNRVIMTAAIQDRPSFGCSTDTVYTYWDECMLDNIPHNNTWEELYSDVKSCISHKEARLGFQPSLPQAFFGKKVRHMAILDK